MILKREKKNPLCIHLWSKQVYTFLNNQDRHEKQREKQESEDDSSFQVSVITTIPSIHKRGESDQLQLTLNTKMN